LTLNASTGAIAGSPTAAGISTFTIGAADSAAHTGATTYAVTITTTTLVISPASLPNGAQGLAYSQTLTTSGGTAPYTWSGQVPAGLTLRRSGLLLGAPSAKGTSTFAVSVTDATGATTTGKFSLTVTDPPPPTPPGCQTGGVLKEPLSGPSFNGKTPSGQASADETRFSGCGGFSLLSVQVKDVNLPDGSVLWVTLDFSPVGTITLRGGSGTMATYNMGRFGVSNDDVRVYSALPDISTSQQILIGGAFQ
jgi:hypothetical protein